MAFAVIFGCQKSESPITNDSDSRKKSFFTIPSEEIGSSKLEGVVSDQDGNPLANVTVQYGNESVQTNNRGYYFLNKLSDGESKPIYFQKNGYMMTQKLASIDENRVSRIDASLYQVEVDSEVDSKGAKLVYEDFEVNIPEGAYTEKVNVKATAYRTDDENFAEAFPGDFEGERENNIIVPIESFGFLNVEVTNNKGFVDPNLPVTLKIKAPEEAPNSIPMWYYDFVEKKWIEEGSWNLVDGYFVGEVNHFTPWNVDIPRDPPRSEIFGRVIDQNGNALANALVKLTGENRSISGQVYTNEEGRFSVTTLRNTEFTIEASWSFYYPTLITKASSGEDDSQVDAGDIIIDVSDENEADPIISEPLIKMLPGENVIIRGNYFGNEFRTNYKVLVDDIPVEIVRNWSNKEIQFTAPTWINITGKVVVMRGNIESNVVDYEIPDEMWTIYEPETTMSLFNITTVTSILENEANEVLFGTFGTGVIRYANDSFDKKHIMELGDVENLHIDNNGVLWIAASTGLYSMEDGSINNHSILGESIGNCYSVTSDEDNNIWIATIRNGLYLFDESGEFTNFNVTNSNLPSNMIRTVHFSKSTNSLWLGTVNGGLCEYDNDSFTIWNMNNSNIPDNTIYAINEDGNGVFWLGTQNGGIAKFENNQFEIWNTQNSDLPSDDVPRITNSRDGRLWIGTWGGGLVRFDKDNEFEIWDTQNSDISGNNVHSVFEASDGSVWVGLYQGGIAKLNFRNMNP